MKISTSKPVHTLQTARLFVTTTPKTRSSRGGIDEINPEDIIYGEYSNDNGERYGEYIDLIYLDGDILRTFSDNVNSAHHVIDELSILLRDDKKFYVVLIKELKAGLAFKRNDIQDIKVTSVVSSNPPSCVWAMQFENGTIRTLETDYQSYFAYGSTVRPKSMTNEDILNKVFPKQ